MNQYSSGFGNMPPVVKNLMIINGLVYLTILVTFLFQNVNLQDFLAYHMPMSKRFEPFQIVSHMFTHSTIKGNGTPAFMHIAFNMFALWMFGSALENIWGPKRFLVFYLLAGFGSLGLFTLVNLWEINQLREMIGEAGYQLVLSEGADALSHGKNYVDESLAKLNSAINTGVVGASGAIFGLLVAYGMLFPNTELMLIFLPIPIKAKFFIPILIVVELFLGVGNFKFDNIAHFAHLGGALFGFIIVKIWSKDRNNFY